jgi:hypothetical protein
MDLVALLPILLIAAGVAVYVRWQRRRDSVAAGKLKRELADQIRIASDPRTDISVLRQYLTMPIPRDGTFQMHIEILRAVANNASLPTELQAAAINRISSEEMSARSSKSKKGGGGGSRSFFAVTDDFSEE